MSEQPKKIMVDVDVVQRLLIDAKNITRDERMALIEAIDRARSTR